jgi:endonuclease/exonuclease/phosphatase family metal-dependent hydrolase
MAAMNFVTWNVNHRSRQRSVPPTMAKAIASLEPDLVVLTEYVPGADHTGFVSELAETGLVHALWTERVVGQNSVLIASRARIVRGDLRAGTGDAAFPSNVLHVCLPDDGVEVLGVRIPDYSRLPALKRACWDWVQEAADALQSRRSIILGDFNTDPSYSRARCGDQIAQLVHRGWNRAAPPSGASYCGPNGASVCIDHAFVSRSWAPDGARYVTDHSGFSFSGKQVGALSDHAALVVSVPNQRSPGPAASLPTRPS